MKTNVVYLETKYNVNKEKHACHCRLDFVINCNNVPGFKYLVDMDEFSTLTDKVIDENNEWYRSEDGNVIGWKFSTHGTSKCADTDKFDEKTGKYLALTRAQRQAFVLARNFYQQIINTIYSVFINDLSQIGRNCAVSAFNCFIHEHKLTNDTEFLEQIEYHEEDEEDMNCGCPFPEELLAEIEPDGEA